MKDEVASNIIPQKRLRSEEHLHEDGLNAKKPRMFSIKEFRKQLNSSEKLNAIKEFLSAIINSSGHDYVYDYLKNGGNCLELLQCLESDSTIPPTLVFDLVTQLLLRINASYRQYYSSAHESCRYLINNYLPLVHKMLGLSSSKDERKACLKLLTAMATFSANLARDILINVKFHSTNIELLTKHTGEANSVRDCFIHFLTAFLVDSDMHTLSILLEKSGLLTAIISGLQYDVADTVCVVVTAMKNHILENNAVMKTTKMHVFNTSVVKDIVNLYNWKGPEGMKALDKNTRTVFEVDKRAKSKVNECVHDFLLVLCTSHKHGVIFRDHLVGLGKKNQNGLMYTVLDSLDRPWEHSYASELVINICRSCPDLTKNLWSILKPFLQPRLTEKWILAMAFAQKLVEVMEPDCIAFCFMELSPQQLAQIIEFLVSPSPILKVLINFEANIDEEPEIKQYVSVLLCVMLQQINKYLHSVQQSISLENYSKVKQYICNYVGKNFPYAQRLLEDWKSLYLNSNTDDVKKKSTLNKHKCLETILNILNLYKSISPQLLHSLTSSSLDLKELLLELTSLCDEVEKPEALQTKIVSIFVDVDRSYFLPKTDIFSYVVPLLVKIYHKEKNAEVQCVLHKILKNTGIFDGSLYEINLWLNGIFNFRIMTEDFAESFLQIFKNTAENALEYQKELSEVNAEDTSRKQGHKFIDALLDACEYTEDNIRTIRHRHCSPTVLGLLKHLQDNDSSKNMKKFSEFVLLTLFHWQTNTHKFLSIIQSYSEHIPANIFYYFQKWDQGLCEPLIKLKGTLEVFKTLSVSFLNGDDISEDVVHGIWYPDFLVDVFQMATFYFSNLIEFELVSQRQAKNWVALVDFVICKQEHLTSCLEIMLENPVLLKHFDVTQFGKGSPKGICTEALISVLEKLVDLKNIETYRIIYSRKTFDGVVKIIKKPKKHVSNQNVAKILEVCPLEYKDCIKLIIQCSELLPNSSEFTDDFSITLEILKYCLNRILLLCRKNVLFDPVDAMLIATITTYLANLNKANRDNNGLSKALRDYLEVFPHSLSHLDPELFSSILLQREYNKENADLAVFLLKKNLTLARQIEANITSVVDKKGLILPLVEVLVDSEGSEDVLKIIYTNIEASLLKAIQKPQKVGQHFLRNYNVGPLICKFMSLDKCAVFADKTQKFEVTEVFHVKLLEACYNNILSAGDINEKQFCSIILTFVHLKMALFHKKTNLDKDKISEISNVFNGLLDKLASIANNRNFSQVTSNETFKQFCKIALKYGVSGQHALLQILNNLLQLLTHNVDKEEASLLLEMLLSHSEFLNVVLGEGNETKLEVLTLFLTICRYWSGLMEKSHVAVILSAYRATVTRCDRAALELLKLYESKAEQTRFYDFKPFLWGRAAATHYSVRTQIENSLIRQPKISDVLGILKEDLVNLTITNHPLKDNLHQATELPVEDLKCYDLKFLLPLFSHILAPEQQVKTYVFSRSGALSLTIAGLSNQDTEVRQAACHVLSRFHFHLEARQTGKDNLLWIRLIEALCKGAAVLPDFRVNNFASIFYARMALVLTNPRHVMYTPLSSYLTAKEDLDLSTVPELYTLLFSSDVNYKEHRTFILEIVRDGIRTDKDFLDFLKSMGFKLFSELFSSCLSDMESRLLMLEIFLAATKISLAVNILCEHYSFLSQLHTLTSNILSKIKGETTILSKLLLIYLNIAKTRQHLHTNQLISDSIMDILRSDSFSNLKDSDVGCFHEVLFTVYTNNPGIFRNNDVFINTLFEKVSDTFCIYVRKFGCRYISDNSLSLEVGDKNYFLRLLIYKLFV